MDDPLGLIGTKIDDKYEIESVVGEGGFAVVYRAQHLIFKRPVAIKAFRALSDFGAEERDRLVQGFIQEGALLADLSERSVAIVQARDIGTVTTPKGDWVPYMVLEWLDGASLEAVISAEKQKGLAPRDVAQTVHLLDPVAEALALAHRRGIAHRDVKPPNIFIIGDPRSQGFSVKLLDFGIAKVVQDAQKLAGSFNKTSGQVTSFTPAYGAPEQFSRTHGATGPWTDVFALALVATEVLTQRDPLEGDSFVQLGYASADKTRRPTPRTLGATVSDGVEAIFQKALAVVPEERFQSAGEFWNALRGELAMKPMRATLADTGPMPVPASPVSSSITTDRTISVAELGGVTGSPGTTGASMPSMTSTPVLPTTPRSGGKGWLFAVAGLVVVLGGVGAYLGLTHHSKDATPPAASSAPVAVTPPVPTKPTCPKGMIYITGGEFFMGSTDAAAKENEKPAHHVALTPYCIDATEVTTEAYKACSDVGKCPPAGRKNVFAGLTPHLSEVLDPLCNIREPAGKARHPINCVDWEMAANYCKVQGGHLPTEAQWEFAARGPDGRAYPWGDDPPSARFLNACGAECVAWGKKNKVDGQVTFASMFNDDDGFATTAPVGSFPDGKSRYGLMDVDGNVWEWTGDYFAPYTKDAQKDPTGPKDGEDRVARGGSWNGSDPSWVRPTFRFHFQPDNRSYGIGMRCAASPK